MKHLYTFETIDWRDIELVEIKYKKVTDRLLETLDGRIRSIVEKMLSYEVAEYDRCLLDVKVRKLSKDDFSCALSNLHYDWVRTYEELPEQHETHFIYSNINGTEFENGEKCLDNSIYTYGRELHKGVVINEDTIRILIRLSYVNNKPIAQKKSK